MSEQLVDTANLNNKNALERENFALANIYTTRANTFIHITTLDGAETISRFSGGQFVKNDRDEASPYAAMQAAQKAAALAMTRGITAVHLRLKAKGGVLSRSFGPGLSACIRALARSGLKVGRIEDVTPTPADRTRAKGGNRGRRL
eukprot:GAHX01000617.1.p1 GENE.GAHX01000617.1~~GAHX01000617.1.p1  ORF type:complete len:146 (+),score=23.26 GAHX01000617.1:56-493(+)